MAWSNERPDFYHNVNISALIFITILSYPSFLDAFSLRTTINGDGIVINSEYPHLCQGEALKVSLKTPSPLLQAQAHCMEQEFAFVPSRDGSQHTDQYRAAIDPETALVPKIRHDVAGHDNRPDVLWPGLDRSPRTPLAERERRNRATGENIPVLRSGAHLPDTVNFSLTSLHQNDSIDYFLTWFWEMDIG